MFSPDASIRASIAARNPRRRQRTGSDDSVDPGPHQKRQKRRGLGPDTFLPPNGTKLNGDSHHGKELSPADDRVTARREHRNASVDTASLAVRKKGPKRSDRATRSDSSDTGNVLTRNDHYAVTQLRSTPDRLCDYEDLEPWQGKIFSDLGYALAVMHTKVTIWRYTPELSRSGSSKHLTIKLPYPSTNAHQPLPLCALSPEAQDPGLLVVMPVSGKIAFWESLSSAANEDPSRQKQHATFGSISGMVSSERVKEIADAGKAGFVLVFNTGRIAHLTLRDSKDKPSMSVSFLRGNGSHSGGLFSGLKNVFSSGGWRRDVAAVKAATSRQKGQKDVIVATTKGIFQIWDLNNTSTDSMVCEVDAKEDIFKLLVDGGPTIDSRDDYTFEILDFVVDPRAGTELAKPDSRGDYKLLVLTALSRQNSSTYSLIELSIAGISTQADVIHPISCYATSISTSTVWNPKLLLPAPGRTAFIVFDKAVVLLSLSKVEASPDSQLQTEAHTLPDAYQDVICFRTDKNFSVVGGDTEPRPQDQQFSSCIVLVYGFGTIRIAALPEKENLSASERARVTAKTKIEQAIFFGSLQNNLLDFSGRSEVTFLPEEVDAAALEISDQIMKSTTSYLPPIAPSMDDQLKLRSTALADLMMYIRKTHSPLPRETRWKLIWNAEKLSAARSLWNTYNDMLGRTKKKENPLLIEVLEMLHENFKIENQPDLGETDIVRHWFVHDIGRIEYIIPWFQHAILELKSENRIPDDASLVKLIDQANDIQLSALEAAFRFREENMAAYGFDMKAIQDGVLRYGYEELPEFWTSTRDIVLKVKELCEMSAEMAYKHENTSGEDGCPTFETVKKLAANNPRQIQVCCQTYTERYRWLLSQEDPRLKSEGDALKQDFMELRRRLLVRLFELGLPDQSMELAVKYHDMDALVHILLNDTGEVLKEMERPGISEDEKEYHKERLEQNGERTTLYFSRFGKDWSDAFYAFHVQQDELTSLLDTGIKFQEPLAQFLQGKPAFAKIKWINDVLVRKNYSSAADALNTAQKQETGLWSKRIQLSMGKLSLLAASEKDQETDKESTKSKLKKADKRMAIVKIQDQLYAYVRPITLAAVDRSASAHLVSEELCKSFMKTKRTLFKTIAFSISRLVSRHVLDPEQLIDILTSMDRPKESSSEEREFFNQRFFLAFEILSLQGFETRDPERKELDEKIIWRRCMIQDDWEELNKTDLKPDTEVESQTGATALFETLKEGYRNDFWSEDSLHSPSSLIEAGTTVSTFRPRYRFYSDSLLQNLAADCATEDAQLQHQIEKGRLELWFPGVVTAAEKAARDEADKDGERRARRRSLELRVEDELKRRDKVMADGETHLNGVDLDAQGDVIME